MATLLAWQDFNDLIRHADEADGAITALHSKLDWIIEEIEKVTTDVARRNAVIEIANLHPTYTVAYFQDRLADIKNLRAWMATNGY